MSINKIHVIIKLTNKKIFDLFISNIVSVVYWYIFTGQPFIFFFNLIVFWPIFFVLLMWIIIVSFLSELILDVLKLFVLILALIIPLFVTLYCAHKYENDIFIKTFFIEASACIFVYIITKIALDSQLKSHVELRVCLFLSGCVVLLFSTEKYFFGIKYDGFYREIMIVFSVSVTLAVLLEYSVSEFIEHRISDAGSNFEKIKGYTFFEKVFADEDDYIFRIPSYFDDALPQDSDSFATGGIFSVYNYGRELDD